MYVYNPSNKEAEIGRVAPPCCCITLYLYRIGTFLPYFAISTIWIQQNHYSQAYRQRRTQGMQNYLWSYPNITFSSSNIFNIWFMVLKLYGNSEIGAHIMSNLCYLTWLSHLIRSRAVTYLLFFPEKTYFPSCVRNMFWVTI